MLVEQFRDVIERSRDFWMVEREKFSRSSIYSSGKDNLDWLDFDDQGAWVLPIYPHSCALGFPPKDFSFPPFHTAPFPLTRPSSRHVTLKFRIFLSLSIPVSLPCPRWVFRDDLRV